jgi:hypothetical protein
MIKSVLSTGMSERDAAKTTFFFVALYLEGFYFCKSIADGIVK